MSQACPMPVVDHGVPPSQVDRRLMQASHVFLRVDAVRRPLVAPYEGPFAVLERSDKTFVILKKEKPVTVTIDRLKPALFLPESESEISVVSPAAPAPPPAAPPPADPTPSPAALDPEVWPLPTRFGRRPRPPERLNI